MTFNRSTAIRTVVLFLVAGIAIGLWYFIGARTQPVASRDFKVEVFHAKFNLETDRK